MTDTPKTLAEMPATAISFTYTNWRGETARRRAVPVVFFWGATEHHPEEQWIVRALDLDKNAARDFALKDCDFRRPLPSDGPVAVPGERIDYTAEQLRAMGQAYASAYADALAERAVSDDEAVARAVKPWAGEPCSYPCTASGIRCLCADRCARAAIAAMRGE